MNTIIRGPMNEGNEGSGRARPRGRLVRAFTACVLAVTVATGCEVTNPGPVQDEFLSDASAREGLVAGAGYSLALALMSLAHGAGFPAREIISSGQIGAAGWDVINQGGYWEDGDGPQWNNLSQARFIAEDAINRFVTEGGMPAAEAARSALVAKAYLWAGYASRVFGEHYCYVVFDGGGVEPSSAAFERAEEHFTNAIEVASAGGHTDLKHAGHAGRAQVRAWLGDWAGAASDAGEVPSDFVFYLPYDGRDDGARNILWFATANDPYRTYSVWQTFYEGYYQDTGDPRTPNAPLAGQPWSTGALSGYGQVPFVQQLKYPDGGADIRLASGWEMRLLEAEALLREGNWQVAMALVNEVRIRNVSDATGETLDPWQAGSLNEAWRFLKRERGIELWLEGRRFGDMRRWEEQNAPGALDWPDLESISPLFSDNPRSRCFSVDDGEREANPNVEMTLPTTGLWVGS